MSWDSACQKPEAGQIPTLKEGVPAEACDRTDYSRTTGNPDFDPLALLSEASPSIFRIDKHEPHSFPFNIFLGEESVEAIGTGFAVAKLGDDCLIATADHVVENSTINNTAMTVTTSTGETYSAEPQRLSPDSDLALIRVPNNSASGFVCSPLELSQEQSDEAKQLAIFGYPLGSQQLFMSPADATGRTMVQPELPPWDTRLVLPIEAIAMDGHVEPNNSGSPVLAPDGKVVGVTIATVGNTNAFAAPIEGITGLIERTRKDPKLAIESSI